MSFAERWGMLGFFAIAIACQGSQVGESDPRNDAGIGSTGGATTGGSGGTAPLYGPGPNGSLPSGYCCTTDQDCRYRTCLDLGSGVKMCSDPCTFEDACNSVPNLTCDLSSEQCMPTGAPSCIPSNDWPLGDESIGACCSPTFDGLAGKECQGNLCVAFGDESNPYICTQACDAPKDCPPKYECNQATRFCWPLAEAYDCE